ncbi:MAG: AMP-binding protein [Thermodesulfobacteriota bacterium]
MGVQHFLRESAARYPDKVAVIQGRERITYAQLASRAGRVANRLQAKGLLPGERVAILSDQAGPYIAAYFGVLAAGGVVQALNSQPGERDLLAVMADSGASFLLTQAKYKKFLPALAGLPALRMVEKDMTSLYEDETVSCRWPEEQGDDEDLAQLIYTSGTTGPPKGVMLRHRNLMANSASIISYLGLQHRDRVMAVLPFFYSYGNSVLLTHIAVGATLVVHQNFTYPNTVLELMRKEEVTGFSGVPSTFALLLNRSAVRDYYFPALRYLTQAGAAMSPALAGQLRDIFPGVAVYIMYGQTEASARLAYLAPEELEARAGSIGQAIPGVELLLAQPDGSPTPVGQVGEIIARGGNVMAGYWQRPEESAKVLRDGWLWTGDLARQDENGYFYVESRKGDMIKSGSHRIGPQEIEHVIMESGPVHEVAVVGVADEILGEAIRACVVLKPETKLAPKELIRHCRRLLPGFKVPHRVDFFAELPKTATGKIKKAELRT